MDFKKLNLIIAKDRSTEERSTWKLLNDRLRLLKALNINAAIKKQQNPH